VGTVWANQLPPSPTACIVNKNSFERACGLNAQHVWINRGWKIQEVTQPVTCDPLGEKAAGRPLHFLARGFSGKLEARPRRKGISREHRSVIFCLENVSNKVSQSRAAKVELFQNIVWNFLLQFFCGKGVAVHGYNFRTLHGRGVRRMHRTQFPLSSAPVLLPVVPI
jgi:hypothetical protein